MVNCFSHPLPVITACIALCETRIVQNSLTLLSWKNEGKRSLLHYPNTVFGFTGILHKNNCHPVVGTLFIDIGNIYCFVTGLPILMPKDIYQYHHFKYNCQLTLQIFEIKLKSEEIVHFYLTF